MCHPGSQVFSQGYGPNPPCRILLLELVVYHNLRRLNNPSEEMTFFINPSYHLRLLVTLACVGVIVCDYSSNPMLGLCKQHSG